jgi:Kef-type K+ transport system membrane component KefB/nucleotide-binding universal stress UspA family protein
MPPAPDTPRSTSTRRFLAIYAALAVAVAVCIPLSIAAGTKKHAQPSIAGGYDTQGQTDPCLGRSFDIAQSGQFVDVSNAEQTLSGKLRLHGHDLTGTIDCTGGAKRDAHLRVSAETLSGSLGGAPLTAVRKREPPDPGARASRAPGSVNGDYVLSPPSQCLGGKVTLDGATGHPRLVAGGKPRGELAYAGGRLTGAVACTHTGSAPLSGTAADRKLDVQIGPEHVIAQKQREFGKTLAAFFVAIAVVILIARLVGALAVRVAQPRVMGEVIAGIALGPTVFGALAPGLQVDIFPTDVIPLLGVVANLGLIFYMFLVGLELDLGQLKGRVAQAAAISNTSVALPMVLGVASAIPIYGLVAPDKDFAPFALFMGVAMSITAFPVLARILVERRMLKQPVGALAMAAAAIDDVTAWFLIALAIAVASAGSSSEVVVTVGLAIAFCLAMLFVVRPVLARASDAYDEAGRVPTGWIAAIFIGVLLSAWTTETIGVALIFGAFVMGLAMPRHTGLTEDVTGRIEDFVVTLLLPLFFVYTGLRTDVGLLDRPELWLLTVALIVVAITGKLLGAMLVARATGFGWRAAAVIGTLMNTRGLTELIVLNIALEKGIISQALFASLVIMALVTTLMAGPVLRLLDPKNSFGAPVEEEFDQARRESSVAFPTLEIPDRAILLAPQSKSGLAQLRALAEPLAAAEPPRELILTKLVRPPRGAAAGVRGGLQTENRLLLEATGEMRAARDQLVERRIAARAVAFISPDPGGDLSRVAAREDVDLVLMDGRRPLLGEGVPRGEVGAVLDSVPCDVAVLVARDDTHVSVGADSAIVVPFGGAEHDWAALELGAWLASATGARLKLLGAAGTTEETSRVTRLLSDAGLLVQTYAGVVAEPLVAQPDGGIIEAASDAGLLVVGLSQRWREEGLGPVRSRLAKTAPAPVLFVRRGTRPGALAPERDVTRFTWSTPRMG